MNAVWNSYGQLCGCPEIFKKSCKFFCRVLDIRVPQIVEPKAWHFNRLNHVLKLLMDILLAIMAANSIGKNKPLFIFP